MGGVFALARAGVRVLTFQCSLRLSPAAASVAAAANTISATATTTTHALLGVLEERGSIGTGFQTGKGQAQRLLVWVGDGRGLGSWVGSAGLVLRSQGTSGWEGFSRWRARGMRVLTFQCSLRLSPAAATLAIPTVFLEVLGERGSIGGSIGTGSGACGKGLGWEGWGLEGSGSEASAGL